MSVFFIFTASSNCRKECTAYSTFIKDTEWQYIVFVTTKFIPFKITGSSMKQIRYLSLLSEKKIKIKQVFFPHEAQKLSKIHFKEFSKFSLIAKERQKKLKTLTSILLSYIKLTK